MKKLFIGKLSLSTTESGLRNLFSKYEPLSSVKIITDKFSGESRGFGFIEIEDGSNANAAIEALDGTMLDGRAIVVNEARPQGNGSGGYGRAFNDRDSRGSSGRNRNSDFGHNRY